LASNYISPASFYLKLFEFSVILLEIDAYCDELEFLRLKLSLPSIDSKFILLESKLRYIIIGVSNVLSLGNFGDESLSMEDFSSVLLLFLKLFC